MAILNELQERQPPLVCDRIYRAVISKDDPSDDISDDISRILENVIENVFSIDDRRFELTQFLDLPETLGFIQHQCQSVIARDPVDIAIEMITDFVSKHRAKLKLIGPNEDIGRVFR